MNYVLEFLDKEEIKDFLDEEGIKVLNYLLRKVLFSQPELLKGQTSKNIQMTKEFLEQWIAQAMSLKTIGAGNYPIDVLNEKDKIGIDIKFVSAGVKKDLSFINKISNETSLAQNFANEGNSLDQLFMENIFKKILDNWRALLKRKFKRAIDDFNLEQIFYFIFIRGGNSISLAITKVFPERLNGLKVDYGNDKSVFVKNFSNPDYSQVKIYKSKKRMELRTYPKNLLEKNKLLEFNFNDVYKNKTVDLRKLIGNEKKFSIYLKKEFSNLFGIYIKK